MTIPPSTSSDWPVMYDARGERAAATATHRWKREPREPDGGEQREIYRAQPRFVVELIEPARLRTARVRDDAIDGAEPRERRRNERLAALGRADVGVDADGLGAGVLRDLLRCALDRRAFATAHRDARALARELLRDREAKPVARRRDERDLAAQPEVRLRLPPRRAQVRVGAVDPVVAPRTERVRFIGVFERDRRVRNVRRDHDDLTRAHVVRLSRRAEDQAQGAGQDLSDLLRLMDVFGDLGPLGQPDLRDHRALAVAVAPLPRAAAERLGLQIVP